MSTTYASPARPGQPVEPDGSASAVRPSGFRPDIEGLRAVAILLVVLDHTGVPLIGGGYVGVDVFFVISGFLITSLLVRELAARGTLSIAGFYGRRALRLLPASTLVVLVTLVASWLWLSPIRFPSIARDALTSTFYGLNYRLAIQGTDYLNAAATPSPLQHFWSLAVEEQFYLIWPLLLLTAAWVGRRRGSTPWRPIAVVLIVLTAVSFVASVVQTKISAPWAYFSGYTRAWELGVGALLALVAGALAKTPRPVAAVVTWLGLGAIVAAALTFDETTAFPGYAAALPVVGAALVIAGGCAAPSGGAGLVLDRRPAQLIGKLSYGWYLWHWPVLMIAPAALGLDPGVWLNLGLAAGALGLAAASYAWVEQPVRSRRWLRVRPVRGVSLGLSLSGAVAVLALLAPALTPSLSGDGTGVDTRTRLNAAHDPTRELLTALTASTTPQPVPSNLEPTLAAAADDKPLVSENGCSVDFAATTPRQCVFGDPHSTTTVVLFGDSHAAQWFPAMEAVADARGWRLVSITKDACPAPDMLVYRSELKRAYTECQQWRDGSLAAIEALHPSLVVLASSESQTASDPARNTDAGWAGAWTTTIERIRATGSKVTLLSDTPRPFGDAPECLAQHLADFTACAQKRSSAVQHPQRRQLVAAAATRAGATVIDPLPWFCTDQRCPPIVGNVLVYRDESHITATYARLLAPLLTTGLNP